MPPAPPAADVVRIFVSTDNHVGYGEKELVRAQDSFGAFEEVLVAANECHSDMLLLGGDLFHDNKPSRSCVIRTMQLLKKHCMGDAAVQLEAVDVTSMGFEDDEEAPMANYEDPNLNISLPVFIIHGNHDDPSGDGQYSALDILSTAGLINYFGKQKNIEDLVIKPVLLRKGNVNIALYGLGNIRDERLYVTMKSKKINWLKPDDSEDKYFNILVIHQNKVDGRKNSLHIEWIPKWIDLVVWGHEHECLIDPRKEGPNEVYVMQPGSTVATSLIKGESERKHMAYLDIKLDQKLGIPLWKHKKMALNNVRPFVYEEVCLQASDCGPTEEDVKRFLQGEVDKLIELAKEEYPNAPDVLRQPLVRLKVEHTGFPQLHSRRFGQLYAGQKPEDWKVANPLDILSFWRRRKTAEHAPRKDRMDEEDEDEKVEDMLEAPEIEKLVEEELERGPKQMEVLNRFDLAEAVNKFVHKEEAKAINACVETQLKDAEKDLCNPGEGGGEDMEGDEALKKDVMEKLNVRQQKLAEKAEKENRSELLRKREQEALNSHPGGRDEDDDEHSPPPSGRGAGGRAGGASKAAPKGGRGGGGGASSRDKNDSGDDSFNDDHADKPTGRGRGRAKANAPAKGRAAGRGKGAADPSQSQLSFGPAGASQSQSQARPKRKAAAAKSYEDNEEDEDRDADSMQEDDAEAAFEASKRQKRARRHESDED